MPKPSQLVSKFRKGYAAITILFVFSATISLAGGVGLHKASSLYRLNFLHMKYISEAEQNLSLLQSERSTDIRPLIDSLRNIKAQPAACLDVIGPVERKLVVPLGYGRAIEICEVDLALAETAINFVSQPTFDATQASDFGTANDYLSTFREYSLEFETFNKNALENLQFFSLAAIIFTGLPFALLAGLMGRPLLRMVKGIERRDLELNALNEKLEETNEVFEVAVNASSAGVFDWRIDTDQVIFSEQSRKMLDLSIEEFPDHLDSWRDRLHPDDSPRLEAAIIDHFNRSTPYDVTYRIRHGDGNWRWWRSTGLALRDEDGNLKRFVGFNVDISKLKYAEEEARTANETKSSFLANMSHEIRTPLNAILGMADVLRRDETSPKKRERLELIRSAGDTLLRIVDDVLDLSKVEKGKVEFETVSFDCDDLVHSVASIFALKADEKGLLFDVQTNLKGESCFNGDPTRIRQILTNLISNAVKFTDDGKVSVAVHSEPLPDQVQGSETAGKVGLVFTVSDTGSGIRSEAIERLFEPFTQTDETVTRRHGGTGLGLAIAQQLAIRMGGHIDVETEPGKGSTFTFTLALEPAESHQATPSVGDTNDSARQSHESAETPLSILVAEDNAQNRIVLEAILEVFGVEMSFAENGREAVHAWDRGNFDVILMDIQMPIMNGIDATREIRSREAKRGLSPIPIIAVSANVMHHQVDQYYAAGMNGVVGKPIKVPKLISALESISAQRQAA